MSACKMCNQLIMAYCRNEGTIRYFAAMKILGLFHTVLLLIWVLKSLNPSILTKYKHIADRSQHQ